MSGDLRSKFGRLRKSSSSGLRMLQGWLARGRGAIAITPAPLSALALALKNSGWFYRRIWHVLGPETGEMKEAVEEAVTWLRSAGVLYNHLDTVWEAIVKAEVCRKRDGVWSGALLN